MSNLDIALANLAAFILASPVGSADRARALRAHRLLSDLRNSNGGAPEARRYVMQQLNG